METTLKRFGPVIYFEIHGLSPQEKEHDLKRILKSLERYDYTIKKLAKGLPEVPEVAAYMNKENCGGAYVAYRDKLALNIEKALNNWTL